MRVGLVVGLVCVLGLAGCGGGAPVVSTVSTPIAPLSDVAVTGVVSSGTQPMVGAHVYLFAAGTTGYGGAGIAASSSNASVSVVSAEETGSSDSVGAYVVTGANGNFSLTGDYACTSGQQLYLYALGGNSGSGVNSAAGMLAAIGACPSSGSSAVFATVNEVSTVAAAYAMAGFATDAVHVGSSGTALAQVGVANAFANAGNLATLSTGVALATTPAGNGTVPQAEIDTLANVLASCVNASSGCSSLQSTATVDGTATGTKPTDTATAAIDIAHYPGVNLPAIYGMASAAVFSPHLTAQPNDFTLALNLTGGGLVEPNSIAIDGLGDAWVGNFAGNSITKLSSLGAILSGTNGYTGGGLNSPEGIAIDGSGNAWIANDSANSVTVLSSSGGVLSGASGYIGGGLSSPYSIAIDGSGNAWIANHTGSGVTKLSSSGAVLSGANGFTGGGLVNSVGIALDGSGNAWIANIGRSVVELSGAGTVLSGSGYEPGDFAYGIAIDGSGNAWTANYTVGSSIVKLSGAGAVLSGLNGYAGGGLNEPDSIAIDGAGNVWSANYSGGSISEFSEVGVALTPSTGFMGAGLHTPFSMAIDGSGDIWVTNQQYSTVSEFIGAGAPVVTPLAVGVKNDTLGTRP